MAFRSEKAIGLILALALAPALAAQPFELKARHDHMWKGCAGSVRIDGEGVSYSGAPGHDWSWKWQDVQRFELSPLRLRVVTYQDNRWELGRDREYRFDLLPGQAVDAAYAFLRDRLDQRFVARFADPSVQPLWEAPAKRLARIRGSEGTLLAGEDRIVYRTTAPEQSMTWRYADIDNLSSSGPFALTLTTLEDEYNFQLKQPLDEALFDSLWRRLNRTPSPALTGLNQDGKIVAFPRSGRITVHKDCWGDALTCQGTRAGGIYNGPHSIFDWYDEHSREAAATPPAPGSTSP